MAWCSEHRPDGSWNISDGNVVVAMNPNGMVSSTGHVVPWQGIRNIDVIAPMSGLETYQGIRLSKLPKFIGGGTGILGIVLAAVTVSLLVAMLLIKMLELAVVASLRLWTAKSWQVAAEYADGRREPLAGRLSRLQANQLVDAINAGMEAMTEQGDRAR